jgi:hypothetical protein
MLEYLCGMSQDVYPADDFAQEVQFYLEQMNEED